MDHSEPTLYGDTPPARVFFQVVIEYAEDHPLVNDIPEEARCVETEPLATFSQAMELADEIAQTLEEDFFNSNILRLELDEVEDFFHLYIIDREEQEIARVGVFIMDLRGHVIH